MMMMMMMMMVKLFLCFIRHHVMKMYEGGEVYLHL
jgi:hypothetical protein